MNRNFPWGGLLWLACGAALALGSIRLKLGTWTNPGAGFTPFLTGSLLALCGLLLIIQTGRRKAPGDDSLVRAFQGFGGKRIYSLIAVCLYALLLEPLGFIPDTFLLLFLLFKILDPRKWLAPLLVSFLAVLLSYLIFDVWLRINLPRGMWLIG